MSRTRAPMRRVGVAGIQAGSPDHVGDTMVAAGGGGRRAVVVRAASVVRWRRRGWWR